MDYQNYEEYLKSVLGYSPYVQNGFTYQNSVDDMFYLGGFPEDRVENSDLTQFYPEIYKIVYPMVCKVCNINSGKRFTKELLEQMTNEIYNNVEPKETVLQERVPLKNGDVRNPNCKDTEQVIRESRHKNYLLQDLIRILLLKEWGRPGRPPYRPPMPPPPRPPFPPPRPRCY